MNLGEGVSQGKAVDVKTLPGEINQKFRTKGKNQKRH